MTLEIVQDLRWALAGLGVAGASIFVTLPIAGPGGHLRAPDGSETTATRTATFEATLPFPHGGPARAVRQAGPRNAAYPAEAAVSPDRHDRAVTTLAPGLPPNGPFARMALRGSRAEELRANPDYQAEFAW